MNASTPSSLHRQLGAASVAIAMLIMFILAAAVTAVMNISGSSVTDAAKNEEQVAALFLAESGVERAQAIIKTAADAGTMTQADCAISALGSGDHPLGGRNGRFLYISAVPNASPCGGGAPCTSCAVTVKGALGDSSRTIKTTLNLPISNGSAKCASQVAYTMPYTKPVGAANALAFSYLGYRAHPVSGGCGQGSNPSNASVNFNCTDTPPGGSSSACTFAWDLPGNGTNDVGSSAVVKQVSATGIYSISAPITATGANVSTVRGSDSIGLVIYPKSGGPAVSFIGAWWKDTGNQNQSTAQHNGATGGADQDWTCQPNRGTTSNATARANAANADALLYGFTTPSSALTNVSFGIQPLYKQAELIDTTYSSLASQIWISYNPSYLSSSTAPGATNSVSFNGSFGATFQGGSGGVSSHTLTIATQPTDGVLNYGDVITCGSGGTCTIPANTILAASATGCTAAPPNTYCLSNASTISAGHNLNASSSVLQVYDTPTPTPVAGDLVYKLTNPGADTFYGRIVSIAGSTYTLALYDGSGGTVQNSGDGTLPTGLAKVTPATTKNLYTKSAVIRVPAAALPSIGTAVARVEGTGILPAVQFTGSISGTTLTTATAVTLCYGDALFGNHIRPNVTTTIAGSAGCTTGTSFTLSPAQTTASGAITARTAVTATGTNSFTVSRIPTTNLASTAVICGGVCAMLQDTSNNVPSPIPLTLGGANTSSDYASGLACLSGVDPNNIQIMGGKQDTNRGTWTEPVQ